MSAAAEIVVTRAGGALTVRLAPPSPMPVEAMMLGRSPEDVVALMRRLFNLCGMAQEVAVRLSLGLQAEAMDTRAEIMRDHLARLCLRWPRGLGRENLPLPPDGAAGGARLRDWLWGGGRPADLWRWLDEGSGAAPLLSALRDHFSPGEAVAELPLLHDPMSPWAQENSPAARVSDDSLMRAAEDRYGRGPLWRALGVAVDLDRLCDQAPRADLRADGTALVAASRGTYAVRARAERGIVTAFVRVTPTDHLLAKGGALERSLASLPPEKAHLAQLVVDILDPCVPVLVREAADA